MLVISSWNVNSINAHLEQVLNWSNECKPDILLLQETKCEDIKFPYQYFEKYNISHNGQKTYNGVAVLSKFPLEDIVLNFTGNPCPEQSRFIQTNINSPLGLIRVISIYVPNGSELDCDKFKIKLSFLKQINRYLKNLETDIPTIIGGDFNVAPFNIDVYGPEELNGQLLFSSQEKSLMRQILSNNFFDLYRLQNQQLQEFSWWDYRAGAFQKNQGCRIDFLLANPKMCNMLKGASIDTKTRGYSGKNSDHVPVSATFCL